MLNLTQLEINNLDKILSPLDCKTLFADYGGKSLGLEITKRISEKIEFLITPPFSYFKFENNPEKFHDNFIKILNSTVNLNKKVACKLSTLSDDFSENSLRGLNSSINNPKVLLSKDAFNAISDLASSFTTNNNKGIKTILLQGFIELSSNVGFITHVKEDEGIVEISFADEKFIIGFNSIGEIVYSESTCKDRSIDKLSKQIDIRQICSTLRKAHSILNFDCNLEGFIDGNNLVVLQLRKIPTDSIFNETFHSEIQNFDTSQYSNITLTKLVCGAFDIEGETVLIENVTKENLDKDLIILIDSSDIKVWELPIISERLRDKSLNTLIVSFRRGFYLSHATEDIPPIGIMRDNFKHICLSWLYPKLIVNKKLRFISDGEIALFCYAESNSTDRKRTIVVKGKDVNFIQLDPNFIPPFEKITSVAVVPFTDNGNIVAAILSRGIDLPGGHVLSSEFTIEEVARREAKEETCITLRDVHIAKIIQSDYYGSTPDKLSYMVITTAFVDQILEFIPTEECSDREIATPQSFIDRYSAGSKADMETLIISSKNILGLKN